jgi:hypothetical protein
MAALAPALGAAAAASSLTARRALANTKPTRAIHNNNNKRVGNVVTTHALMHAHGEAAGGGATKTDAAAHGHGHGGGARRPGENKGFVEEMRFVAMKLHTREQAPKV